MKVCTKCRAEKTTDDFSRKHTSKDGRKTICKTCDAARNKIWYKNNRGHRLAIGKEWDKRNPEKRLKISRKWREENPEGNVKASKKWRDTHPEDAKKVSREWKERNKDNVEFRGRRLKSMKNWGKSPCTTTRWEGILPADDKPEMVEGVLTVACKLCGRRMIPNNTQVTTRMGALIGRATGENNFYCSDTCKNTCPLYRFRADLQTDPRSKLYTPKPKRSKDRACQTDHLKQIQCDETNGQSYCERCGDFGEVYLHHTQRVGSKDAVSSAGHILLCLRCHDYDLHQGC